MKILVITDSFPYPPISGDRIRVYNLIRRISTRNEVWLAAQPESPEEVEGVKHIQGFCAGVVTGLMKRHHPIVHLPGLIRFGLSGIPLEIKFSISQELVKKIKNLLTGIKLDLVHIEQSYQALYQELIGLDKSCKRVLGFQNVLTDQYDQIAHLQKDPIRRFRPWLYSASLRRWEPRYAEHFSKCITVSEADRTRLLALNSNLYVEVIPNGVDCNLFQPLPRVEGTPILLFIGTMSYAPCADAAIFFCKKILPYIRKQIPDIQVWIVGKDPPPEVFNLNIEGITVTGRVNNVVPYYQRSKVCVVPLRAGGGTRLKILEAMALNRPVVSTSIGCEGLEVVDGCHLLVANDPEEFARKTISLLNDDFLYQRIVTNARKLVETHYDWDVIAKRLQQVYMDTCFPNT